MFTEQPPKIDAPMVEHALYCARNGWSPFPVGKNKIPLVSWKGYQAKIATAEQIKEWWGKWPDANIGIATGSLSGIVVIDVEKGGSVDDLPPTLISRTGGQGWHFIYSHPGVSIPNSQRIRPLTDCRGDGGYIVVPPSIHESGRRYEWGILPNEIDPAPPPDFIFPKVENKFSTKDWNKIAEGAPEGQRNGDMASYLGKILHDLSPELWQKAGRDAFDAACDRCLPPLGTPERDILFKSIEKSELQSRQDRCLTSNEPINWGKALTFKELISKEFSEPEWIIDRIVPKNCLTILSGPPGGYKSTLLAHLAISVASESKFIDYFDTHKTGVMIVDEENNERRTVKHIKELTDHNDLPIHYRIKKRFKVTDAKQVELLIEEAKEYGVGLIIFDTLIRIHDLSENDAKDMNKIYQFLEKFTAAGITIVIAHHHRKQGQAKIISTDTIAVSEMMRGSSDIQGMTDSQISIVSIITEQDLYSAKQSIIAVQTKQRDAEPLGAFAIDINRADGKLSFFYAGKVDESVTVVNKLITLIPDILECNPDGISRKEMDEELKTIAKTNTIRKAREKLEKERKVIGLTKKELKKLGITKEDNNGANTIYYFLPENAAAGQISRDPIFGSPF